MDVHLVIATSVIDDDVTTFLPVNQCVCNDGKQATLQTAHACSHTRMGGINSELSLVMVQLDVQWLFCWSHPTYAQPSHDAPSLNVRKISTIFYSFPTSVQSKNWYS